MSPRAADTKSADRERADHFEIVLTLIAAKAFYGPHDNPEETLRSIRDTALRAIGQEHLIPEPAPA